MIRIPRPASSCLAVMLVAMLVPAGLAGCPRGGGSTTPVAETPKDVVEAARAMIEQWRQAYEVRSMSSLAPLYAHDLDVVVVQEGIALLGWSSVEAMLKDRLARAGTIRVRLKDVQVVSLAPEVAAATATMTREIGDGTTTVTESGALTLILRRVDDARWVIVSEHYSYKRGV